MADSVLSKAELGRVDGYITLCVAGVAGQPVGGDSIGSVELVGSPSWQSMLLYELTMVWVTQRVSDWMQVCECVCICVCVLGGDQNGRRGVVHWSRDRGRNWLVIAVTIQTWSGIHTFVCWHAPLLAIRRRRKGQVTAEQARGHLRAGCEWVR